MLARMYNAAQFVCDENDDDPDHDADGDDLTNLDDAAYLFTFLAHKNLHYLIVSHLSNQRDIFYLVTIQPRSKRKLYK